MHFFLKFRSFLCKEDGIEVENLGELLKALREEGVQVDPKVEEAE